MGRRFRGLSTYLNVLGGVVFIPNGHRDAVVLPITYFSAYFTFYLCFEAIGAAVL